MSFLDFETTIIDHIAYNEKRMGLGDYQWSTAWIPVALQVRDVIKRPVDNVRIGVSRSLRNPITHHNWIYVE